MLTRPPRFDDLEGMRFVGYTAQSILGTNSSNCNINYERALSRLSRVNSVPICASILKTPLGKYALVQMSVDELTK